MEELKILLGSSESLRESYAPVCVAKLHSLTVSGSVDNIISCLELIRGSSISNVRLHMSHLSPDDASKEVIQVLHNTLPQIKRLALRFSDTVRSRRSPKANERTTSLLIFSLFLARTMLADHICCDHCEGLAMGPFFFPIWKL